MSFQGGETSHRPQNQVFAQSLEKLTIIQLPDEDRKSNKFRHEAYYATLHLGTEGDVRDFDQNYWKLLG